MKTIKPLRWNITQAASEFGINQRTLSSRIKTGGIEPGNDGKFSTTQVCAAVFGDMDGEKLSKIRAERELLEIELAEKRSELVRADHAVRAWSDIVVAVRQIIKGSSLSDTEKDQAFTNMRALNVEEIVLGTAKLDQSHTESVGILPNAAKVNR